MRAALAPEPNGYALTPTARVTFERSIDDDLSCARRPGARARGKIDSTNSDACAVRLILGALENVDTIMVDAIRATAWAVQLLGQVGHVVSFAAIRAFGQRTWRAYLAPSLNRGSDRGVAAAWPAVLVVLELAPVGMLRAELVDRAVVKMNG